MGGLQSRLQAIIGGPEDISGADADISSSPVPSSSEDVSSSPVPSSPAEEKRPETPPPLAANRTIQLILNPNPTGFIINRTPVAAPVDEGGQTRLEE